MSKFQYLPGLIPVILFEYFFILAMYKYHCCCSKCKWCKCDDINDEDESNVDGLSSNNGETTALRFEDTYESFLPRLKYLLFITRFLSFCYIAGVSVIGKVLHYDNAFLYTRQYWIYT